MMKIICAWCGKLIQEGLEPISHGICRGCVESEFLSHESKPGLAGLETLAKGLENNPSLINTPEEMIYIIY